MAADAVAVIPLRPGAETSALLQVRDLSVRFGGIVALDGVSFNVEQGQICGLIGPNGAGKTTLFSIIAGSVSPSSGTITYSGKDVTRWKSFQAVRAGVARTHQITRPFRSMTTRQNVEIGLRFGRGPASGNILGEVAEILEGVGLGRVAEDRKSVV